MDYVVGIDGGGTKTNAVLADMQGLIVAKASGGPTNPNGISRISLYNTLKTLLQELKKQAPTQFRNMKSLFAGISGAGNENTQKDMTQILKQLLTINVDVQVEPDSINALYSGTNGDPGIVQISGTGSITYGINSQLKHDRVGGWGYLFGDEGSGFDIGRQGIISILRSIDGRGHETKMLEMMYSYFSVNNVYDLIQKVYKSATPKSEISPLSKIVFQAYKLNDRVANEIISNVVKELSNNILTLYRKLFEPDEQVKVVLCGGVFNVQEVLPWLIQNELQPFDTIDLVSPKISPVCGSLIGAYLMNGIKPSTNTIYNMIKTYEK